MLTKKFKWHKLSKFIFNENKKKFDIIRKLIVAPHDNQKTLVQQIKYKKTLLNV